MNWLAEIINENGMIPFSEFMELALYHPVHGYYTSKSEIFGARGDFYTSPGVHSVFSETLGDYIWKRCRETFPDSKAIHIIELGAGNGRLAEGILSHLLNKLMLTQEQVTYTIVERSAALRSEQEQRLQSFLPMIHWVDAVEAIQKTQGFLISNELLDAFPVDIVMREKDTWKQKWIDWNRVEQRFEEIWLPLKDSELSENIGHLAEIEEGCECELNRGLKQFVEAVDAIISEGFVLTVDYGGESDELYGLHHPQGTARSFVNHRVTGNVLENPGLQDITADVDFSFLNRLTKKCGWKLERYERQGSFLAHAGILNFLQNATVSNPFDNAAMKRNMAIKHLILPGGMGDAFRVTLHRLAIDR